MSETGCSMRLFCVKKLFFLKSCSIFLCIVIVCVCSSKRERERERERAVVVFCNEFFLPNFSTVQNRKGERLVAF